MKFQFPDFSRPWKASARKTGIRIKIQAIPALALIPEFLISCL